MAGTDTAGRRKGREGVGGEEMNLNDGDKDTAQEATSRACKDRER